MISLGVASPARDLLDRRHIPIRIFLLYKSRIRVLIAKPRLRCGEGGIGKGNPRQAGDLLGSRAEQFSGDLAVIA